MSQTAIARTDTGESLKELAHRHGLSSAGALPRQAGRQGILRRLDRPADDNDVLPGILRDGRG